MGVPVRKPATYEDLRALPDDVLGQIVDGDLIALPRPSIEHQRAASILGGELSGPFDRGRSGPGGWWILDEPELHLGADVLVPDLAGWRRERVPVLPGGPFLTIAPDWVCEVLSPSTAGIDRVRKLAVYARENVRHPWLVDPAARTLEVLRREAGGWFLVRAFAGEDRVRVEPFDSIEFDLGALWLNEPGG